MLNIVVPMAGRGSRFADVGYKIPKPLIPVGRISMIRLVIENLRPTCKHRFIFVCQEDHVEQYGLREMLHDWAPGCEVVLLNGVTEGAACSVLAAKGLINNANPLMIANSDQYVDIDINEYLTDMGGYDGLIMTMPANDPKWSFVRKNSQGFVDKVVEKQVISNEATVGIYNFKSGDLFVQGATQMISSGKRVNGEFYVAPVYNELIDQGRKIVTYNVGSAMYGLGTPIDLDQFLNSDLFTRVAKLQPK